MAEYSISVLIHRVVVQSDTAHTACTLDFSPILGIFKFQLPQNTVSGLQSLKFQLLNFVLTNQGKGMMQGSVGY